MEKRALVLAAGGEKGAYHTGAMEILLENGKPWDIIAGSSVGAINACYLAQYKKSEAKKAVKDSQGMWLTLKTKDVFKRWCPFGKAHGLWKISLYDSRPLRKTLKRLICMDDVIASDVDLRIGTVDRDTGLFQTFGKDFPDLLSVVLGSSAIPILFLPSKVEGSWQIDGGLRDASPIKAAIEAGATHIDLIMLHPENATMSKMHSPNAFDMIGRTVDILLAEVIEGDLCLAQKNNALAAWEEEASRLAKDCGKNLQLVPSGKRKIEFRIVRPEKPLPVKSLEFSSSIAEELIQLGRDDARRQLR